MFVTAEFNFRRIPISANELEARRKASARHEARHGSCATGVVTAQSNTFFLPGIVLEAAAAEFYAGPPPVDDTLGGYKLLLDRVAEQGWKPAPLEIGVNFRGVVNILNGRKRAWLARELAQADLPCIVKWFAGSEELETPLKPAYVKDYCAARRDEPRLRGLLDRYKKRSRPCRTSTPAL